MRPPSGIPCPGECEQCCYQGTTVLWYPLAEVESEWDGKPDLLVWVGDTHVVFFNDGGGFRPARPGEVVPVSP